MNEIIDTVIEWGDKIITILTMVLVLLKGRTTKTAQEKLVEKNQKALTKQLNKQAKINAKIEKLKPTTNNTTTTNETVIQNTTQGEYYGESNTY